MSFLFDLQKAFRCAIKVLLWKIYIFWNGKKGGSLTYLKRCLVNEFSLKFLRLNSNFLEKTKNFFRKDKKKFQKKIKNMMKKIQFDLN